MSAPTEKDVAGAGEYANVPPSLLALRPLTFDDPQSVFLGQDRLLLKLFSSEIYAESPLMK
jgi:hypothetical protein